MKLFITGGMGYIGSVVAREALKRGDEVLLYDSLIYEQNPERMLKEIGGIPLLVVGDVRNPWLLEMAITNFKPDYVLHFAELSSVYACNHNPAYTEDINYRATIGVFQICERLGIKVLYNSSSSVYGTQKENRLMTEEDTVPEPTDYYTKYKLEVEEYIKTRPNLKIIVFRPATVFGLSPRFRIELLPNHFTYMAVSRKNIPVSGLNAYRAFIDIDDLVRAYFKVMDKGKWKSLIYNVGTYNLSKRECAEGIIEVLPDTKITFAPDIGDLRNLQIDCGKFYDEFELITSGSYMESIDKIADWIKEYLSEIESSNFAEMLNMPLSNWKQICS